MKNSLVAYVGWLLLIAAFGFYMYGIGDAIVCTLREDQTKIVAFPEIIAGTLSSIQALLLTNLGIVLGISISRPDSAMARQLIPRSRPAAPLPSMALRDTIRLFGVVLFLLALIACVITWGKAGFVTDSTKVVPLVSESGKMFFGVVLAYLTAIFSAVRSADEQ